MRKIDISPGDRFGERLTVIEESGHINCRRAFLCRCDCGTVKRITVKNLRNGDALSCGCINRERFRSARKIHGMTGTPTYVAWVGMKDRCYDSSYPLFHRYGGRGITVCDRWRHSFKNFLEDMGERPGKGYSLDRYPNNDGNYEPGNVRWATSTDQNNNRGNNIKYVFMGTSMTVAELSRITGVPYTTLRRKLSRYQIKNDVTDAVHLWW
jgi:hypothetical protein